MYRQHNWIVTITLFNCSIEKHLLKLKFYAFIWLVSEFIYFFWTKTKSFILSLEAAEFQWCNLKTHYFKKKSSVTIDCFSPPRFLWNVFFDHWSTQVPLMHDQKRHSGVIWTCRVDPHHPYTRRGQTEPGKRAPVFSQPPAAWQSTVGRRATKSSLESPGCGLASCPYGAAAGKVCRGPEETQSTGLHQGRKERVVTPWDPSL